MRPPVLLLCLLLPACGHLKQSGDKARAEARTRELQKLNAAATREADARLGEKAAGEIVRVDAGGGFVLVRARNGVVLQTDQEFACRGKGGGRIKVTPEHRGVFFAADVLSGTPAVGDTVIPVQSTTKPKLVPVTLPPGAGGTSPDNTLYLNPDAIRPEDLPRTTLDDPGGSVPPALSEPPLPMSEPPLPGEGPPALPDLEPPP